MKKAILHIMVVMALSGCKTDDVVYKPAPVSVPVPVACEMPVVLHPAWPTADLSPDADLFTQTKMNLAEIELRRAYEMRLVAAMKACQP